MSILAGDFQRCINKIVIIITVTYNSSFIIKMIVTRKMYKFFVVCSTIQFLLSLMVFWRIINIENVIKSDLKTELYGQSFSSRGTAACVWNLEVGDQYIPEYIESHLIYGTVDFIFYTNNTDKELYRNVSKYYYNLGLSIEFRKSTNVKADVWDCITENIFDPFISHVYTSSLDSFLFPLDGKRKVLNVHESDKCTSFKQYNFFKSNTKGKGLVDSHASRSLYGVISGVNNRIYKLGFTDIERMDFIKTMRHGHGFVNCPVSNSFSLAKFKNGYIDEDITYDYRLLELKSDYTLPNF